MPPEEARYAAHLQLGNTTQIREEIYLMNSLGWLETLWQDLCYAVRRLHKSPGFTAVAVLMLGLGIGFTTTVLTVANDFLLRPLPFRNSERLVVATQFSSKQDQIWGPINPWMSIHQLIRCGGPTSGNAGPLWSDHLLR